MKITIYKNLPLCLQTYPFFSSITLFCTHFTCPLPLNHSFFSLHQCTPSVSYFRYYTMLSLNFSLLAVLHNTVSVLDL